MSMCPLYYRCPLADEILLADNVELIKEYLKTPGVLTSEGLSECYESKYCKSNYRECARFNLVKEVGFDHLPEDLLPHQEMRSNEIIDDVLE